MKLPSPSPTLDLTGLRRTVNGFREITNTPVEKMPAAKLNCSTERPLSLAEKARRIYLSRRRRDGFFPPALFAEPAWDMLLDLFIAGERGARVSVSSLCIASSVPQTTALRWISILEAHDLIKRRADIYDGRRILVQLSIKGHAALTQWLAEGDFG